QDVEFSVSHFPSRRPPVTQRSYGIALALGGVCLGPAFADPLKYPETRREDRVDTIHGTTVQDPYRWLEDDVRKNPEMEEWVDAQNKVKGALLEGIPKRKGIEKRITDLWNYERYTAPSKVGGRYFFRKNDGLQNQSVLYVMDKLDGEPRVLIDPNGWSKD